MIVDFLLAILTSVFEILCSLLPSWEFDLSDTGTAGYEYTMGDQVSLDLTYHNPVVAFFSVLVKLDNYLPIAHGIAAVQFLILLVTGCIAFRGVRWLVNLLRGAGA